MDAGRNIKTTLIIIALIWGELDAKLWTVSIPASPPWVKVESESVRPSPWLSALFNSTADDTFNVELDATWFDAILDAPVSKLTLGTANCLNKTEKKPDLCLSEITQSSMTYLRNMSSDGELIYSLPIVHLQPALLTLRPESSKPRTISPEIQTAIYFLLPFHSSVWSMILLYLMTVASLLFAFEKTDRFGNLKQHKEPLDIVDVFLCTTFGVVLHPYRKYPQSLASMVLMIFWYAFCLICVIAYAAGSYVLIFQSPEQFISRNYILESPRHGINCERHSLWCNILKNQAQVKVHERENVFDQNNHANGTTLWLTDHLTASSFEEHTVQQNLSTESVALKWYPAKLDCTDSLRSIRLPRIEISVISPNPQAIWSVNGRIQLLKQEEGDRWPYPMRQWLTPNHICQPHGVSTDQNPVSMKQMNGPLIFMIIGALTAIMVHLCDLFYRYCLRKEG